MTESAVVVAFLVNLGSATRGGLVAWTRHDGNTLAADLGDGYVVKLELVADGFKDDLSPGPDHVVSLSYRGRVVLPGIDRRNVDHEELKRHVPASDDPPYYYKFFVDLWKAAGGNAQEATGHLQAVNRILEKLIGKP